MKKPKILHLATKDTGGAGFASVNLNNIFIENGYISYLVVKKRSKNDVSRVISIKTNLLNEISNYKSKIINKLYRTFPFIKKVGYDQKYCFFNPYETNLKNEANNILELISFKPDIIFLHWVSNFINAKTISELSILTKAKIFWIMMDDSPITGGCHYPWNCEGYKKNCSGCPAILNKSTQQIAELNLNFKKKYLPKNINFIACSESDFQRAKSSILKKEGVFKILLPIDSNKFVKGSKLKARQVFDLNLSKKIILYGSLDFKEIRKGGDYFLKAINRLEYNLKAKGEILSNYIILIAGDCGSDVKSLFQNSISLKVVFAGRLDENGLINAYQAADVFVSASLEDSGPLMINQAIMCGTPVVAFKIGVANDLIINNKTGYLADIYDFNQLSDGIFNVLNASSSEWETLSNNCRKLAIESFSIPIIIEKYKNIF